MLFRDPILNNITDDQGIIKVLLPLFLLSVFLEPGRTINIVMVNALRASGDARFPLYRYYFYVGCRYPIRLLLRHKMEMGLLGIWLGFFADEWLRGLTNAWRWRSRKWQSKRLDVES